MGPFLCLAMMISAMFLGYSWPGTHLIPLLLGDVDVLPVDEHHDVGVLFDAAAVPEVREPGPVVRAVLHHPVQLRTCDEGDLKVTGQPLEFTGYLGGLLHPVGLSPALLCPAPTAGSRPPAGPVLVSMASLLALPLISTMPW